MDKSNENKNIKDNNQIPVQLAGVSRILRAFTFSWDGFIYLLKEAAFRQEFMLTIVAGVALCFIDISLQLKLLMMASMVFVLITEALNTGMEIIIDMISPEYDIRAKAVKDIGSLAVLMSFIIAAIVWGTALYHG